MKYSIKLHLSIAPQEIDLQYYGYSKKTKWEDLTEKQQNEITDPIKTEAVFSIRYEIEED